MDYYEPRLTHASDYDNHIEDNSLALLEYSLDNPKHGINCRAKTKILNEMCLALGIYARRIWLMPYSSVDMDCHVVSEIYDHTYSKWIMLDMTTGMYVVDKEGTPLSILEIRDHAINGEYCTSIESEYPDNVDTASTIPSYANNNSYYMKNMFYFSVQKYNGFGNKDTDHDYDIVPIGFDVNKREISNLQVRMQYSNKDQKQIDGLKKQMELYEEGSDYIQIISPDVMEKSPQQ